MARRRKPEKENEENINRGIKIVEEHKIKITEERKKRLNEDKPVKKRISLALKIIILILIIVTVSIFLEYGEILGLKILDIERQPVIIDNILSSESIFLEYDRELLIYNSGNISSYDKYGKKTWGYQLEDSFKPSIYTKGKYLLIANPANGMLYYFSGKKEIANTSVNGNIERIYIAEDGRFVVQYKKDTGYKKVIAMYDNKAKLMYDEAYINSASIIGIEFLTQKSQLFIAEANSEHINIGTDFYILNYEKPQKLDKIYSLDGKLVYDYRLIYDDIIYVANDKIESFNLSNKQNKEICALNEKQTNYISLYNNYFVIVETKDNGYDISMKRFDNTVISNSLLSNFPKYIKVEKFLTYIVSENIIEVINKWGVDIYKYNVLMSPRNIIVFDDEKSIALIYSNKVEIIGI